MKLIKWLYPGLNVKRWLIFSLLGAAMLIWGIVLIIESQGMDIIKFFEKYFGFQGFNNILLGLFLILAGFAVIIFGLRKMFMSIFKTIFPDSEEELVETIHKRKQLKKGPRIVVLGGGTGLPVLLRGLKNYTSNITAIVTVTDDGGSSGRLREDIKMLPPGDIRNCILALASQESLMEKVLNYRFDRGAGLEGHNLGNLLLAALTQITGDFNSSVREMSRVLSIHGQVLPATLQTLTLGAKMTDGSILLGETRIVSFDKGKISEVYLHPGNCKPLSGTLAAIKDADAIILGPGSLYTSVIPNLLVDGITKEITKTEAPAFYVCNIMTQPGETEGYNAEDHIDAIYKHVEKPFIDFMILNSETVPPDYLERYKEEFSEPVSHDPGKLRKYGLRVLKKPLLEKGDYLRHDSDKLARIILSELLRQKPYSEKIRMFDLILNKRLKILLGWSDD